MKMFQTLKGRLILICALLSLALIIVGLTGYITLQTVSENYSHVAEINLPNANTLQEMSVSTGNVIRQVIRMGYSDISEDETKHLLEKFEEYSKRYSQADKRYQDVPFVEGESALYDQVAKNWELTLKSGREAMNARLADNLADFKKILDGDFRTNYNTHGKALETLIQFQNDQARI